MKELYVAGEKAPEFWLNYFFNFNDWREVERDLDDRGGRLVFNAKAPGMVERIVFDNDADATAFLLRWS